MTSSDIVTFKEKYNGFAQHFLHTISQRYEESGSKKTPQQRFHFSGNDWTAETILIDDYEQHILTDYNGNILQSVEATDCAKAFFYAGLTAGVKLTDNDGVAINNPSFKQLSFYIGLELIHPILYLVKRYRTTRFGSQRIEICLDHYIDIWLGKGGGTQEYAPIYNFTSDFKYIRLGEFVSIKRFTDKNKTEIFNTVGPLRRSFDIQGYSEASYVVVIKSIDGSYNKEEKQKIRKLARNALKAAITSLRLIKSEMVGTPGIIRVERLTRTAIAGFSPLESYDLPFEPLYRPRYSLDPTDVRYFRQIYRMLSDEEFAVWNSLRLPLQQFNRSCQRQRKEDKVLDYVTCLESTLLPDAQEELSYRLSLRAAKLLRTVRDPQKTFDMVRCLYAIRSKIVHANKTWRDKAITKEIGKVGVADHEFMQALESVMRMLLTQIIRQTHGGRSVKDLCKKLDAEILGICPTRGQRP